MLPRGFQSLGLIQFLRPSLSLALAWFVCIWCSVEGNAQPQPSLSLTRVATGLSSPLYATHAPGDPDNLYIVERGGNIKILNLTNNTINPTNFLTRAQVELDNGFTTGSGGDERGLLGLAFHPDYVNNRRFYIYFIDGSGHSRVRSYQRSESNPLTTDSSTRVSILQFNQPFSNHNGGWIGFGPDGYLYIASGDGGSGNDPQVNGQNKNTLLGKMLRIAPSTSSTAGYTIPPNNPFVGQANTRGEIWAYGLRNPWRSSFDRLTGDLYIADVGQGQREEVNFQYAGSTGGQNYGWRLREGMIQTPSVGGAKPADNVDPIYNYSRGSGQFQGISTTGGYVYRGPIAGLQGHYFFADYGSQRLFSLRFNQSIPSGFNGTNYNSLIDWNGLVQLNIGSLGSISSFGEDAQGNLYLVNLGGNVYKFTAGNVPEPTSIAASFVYHGGWTGSGSPLWDALDTTKSLAQPGQTPTPLSLSNVINSSQGLNGVVMDIVSLGNPSSAVWEFKWSPPGAFSLNDNPISNWQAAPAATISTLPGAGTNGSDRVLLQWTNGQIVNRWLSIKVTIGPFSATRFIGHLLGETSGEGGGVYTVSFDDITNIRSLVGQSADAGSVADIDKSGTVSFSDISAMRSNVGTQLTNISIP